MVRKWDEDELRVYSAGKKTERKVGLEELELLFGIGPFPGDGSQALQHGVPALLTPANDEDPARAQLCTSHGDAFPDPLRCAWSELEQNDVNSRPTNHIAPEVQLTRHDRRLAAQIQGCIRLPGFD
jgi:hypothetical protein